jgi:hypothetical protein
VTQIPLGVGAYNRPYGKMPEIRMENRFFEQNPVGAEKVALLSRPGTKLFLEVGEGPIRKMHSQAGVFGGDLFIVSGDVLYRYDGMVTTEISGLVQGVGYPVMTSVAIPGWDALFITDGVTLQYYEGESLASAALAATAIVVDDAVSVGGVVYRFVASGVDAGDPLGTSGAPWLVKLGGTRAASLVNLFAAIGNTGTPGVAYSTDLVENPSARPRGLLETGFDVVARVSGVAGNEIDVSTTGAGISWSSVTLEGGGGHVLKQSNVPDDAGIVDLATLSSYVICAEAASRRFFWLKPGEVDIDPLDFSSAESEPDEIVNLLVAGDQLWIFGQSSTEAWYASGDAIQPFLRAQGRAFSQGVIPGTVARVQDAIVVVGQDHVAYRIAGGPERISHHGIEELLRRWQAET